MVRLRSLPCWTVWRHAVGTDTPKQVHKLARTISASAQHSRVSSQTAANEKLTWSYTHGVPSMPLLGVTIGNLLQDRVEQHPDRDAVVFHQDRERLSFQQLLTQADRLAAALLSLGLKKGDRVGMWAPNCKEWVITQYATARAGLILVNVNPMYQKVELDYALKKVGCKALVAAPSFKDLDYYKMLFELMPELATDPVGDINSHILPDLKVLVMLGKEKFRGAFKFDDILEAAGPAEVKAILDIQDTLQFDDPINIQFTSGTTGFPKGATLSHHNIVNNSYSVGRRLDYHTRVCYGSTETSPVTFQSLRDCSVEKRVSTVGCVASHVEAKVVDEHGSIVPVGVTGELCTRGYTTMLGYWNDVEKTAECIKQDRWFYTGDQAVMEEDGYCRIVGRLKDMIIRGGENVYPTEIEQVLYLHPKVKDVQVIGIPHERLGEEVCAWIQLKSGETATEEELKDFCKQKLARFKVPRHFLFVEEFPMTVTGKVQKFKMREKTVELLGLSHNHPN